VVGRESWGVVIQDSQGCYTVRWFVEIEVEIWVLFGAQEVFGWAFIFKKEEIGLP
jgi:hypothetical protein